MPKIVARKLLRAPVLVVAYLSLIGGSAWATDIPRFAGLSSGVGLKNPTLAFGLSGISDWSTEMPFLDIMHTARPWIGHGHGVWSAMTHEQLRDGGYLDEHGWVKKIPEGLESVGNIWAWGGESGSAAAKSRIGIYVMTWKGKGKLKLWGVKILDVSAGRIIFSNLSGGPMAINIFSTDPDSTGDYIRDISVVPKKFEALFKTGEMFNPEWLSVVQDARELRFMNWMSTNNSAETDWASRPMPDDATWMMRGVPVEVMVQLANQVGAEPWFNMPTHSTDDYVRRFATYVRDHLAPELKVHVEYSNETWNWAFPQTHWLFDQAKNVWHSTDGAAYLDFAAKKATEVALIWNQVFRSQAASRVDNVLAVQTVNPWAANHELTAPVWAAEEPGNYVEPYSVFNSLAVTTYFGVSTVSDPKLRSELLDKIRNTDFDAISWLAAKMMDPTYSQSIPQIEAAWAQMKKVADKYNLHLVAYEGGQHLHHSFAVNGLSKDDLNKLTDFFTAFVRSQQMAKLYSALWEGWAKVSDGPFMQFTDVSAPDKWGSWGLLGALGDTNPRAQLVQKYNDVELSWFGDGGGARYQQGVISFAGDNGGNLNGTEKDDFLIGGKGDDVFFPGIGHDAINGESGDNTIELPGRFQDYTLVREGRGYRLSGPNVSDFVLNVQHFRFDQDEREKSLAEMLGQ